MKEKDIPILDSHHHLWDVSKNYYPFLKDKIKSDFFLGDYKKIRANYLPKEYIQDCKNQNVVGTIHCEAEWDRDDQIGETKWINTISKKYKFPNAIIAHSWLHKKNSEEIIEKQSSFELVKSIRSKPITKKSEFHKYLDYVGTMQDTAWRNGLKLLDKYNLNYDIRIPFWHLIESLQIVRLIPNVRVIINHCGLPWDRTKEGLKKWKDGMKLLSKEPNTYVKLSEFGIQGKTWNFEENKKIILDLIEIFSTSRCMFASNFPVSKLKISYDTLYQNYKQIVKKFSMDEKDDLFWKTAKNVYEIKQLDLNKITLPREELK